MSGSMLFKRRSGNLSFETRETNFSRRMLALHARKLTANATKSERDFSIHLRRAFPKRKITFQMPILGFKKSGFIADYVIMPEKLIIEIDGGYHGDPKQAQADEWRSRELNSMGWMVFRIWNSDVAERPAECAAAILSSYFAFLRMSGGGRTAGLVRCSVGPFRMPGPVAPDDARPIRRL